MYLVLTFLISFAFVRQQRPTDLTIGKCLASPGFGQQVLASSSSFDSEGLSLSCCCFVFEFCKSYSLNLAEYFMRVFF